MLTAEHRRPNKSNTTAESVSSNKSMGLRSDTGEVVKLQKSYYEKVIQNIKEQRDAEIKEREDEVRSFEE